MFCYLKRRPLKITITVREITRSILWNRKLFSAQLENYGLEKSITAVFHSTMFAFGQPRNESVQNLRIRPCKENFACSFWKTHSPPATGSYTNRRNSESLYEQQRAMNRESFLSVLFCVFFFKNKNNFKTRLTISVLLFVKKKFFDRKWPSCRPNIKKKNIKEKTNWKQKSNESVRVRWSYRNIEKRRHKEKNKTFLKRSSDFILFFLRSRNSIFKNKLRDNKKLFT